MYISKLAIHRLRCINKMEVVPHSSCNIIVGENGSGKTSILEAIYMLGFGRTFRKSKTAELVQFDQNDLTIFAATESDYQDTATFGIRKYKNGSSEIKVRGKKAKRLSELSSEFPIISFTSDTIDLIDSGPSGRRKFIDWLVFHVKHSEDVAEIYRQFDKVLEQRNEALKQADLKMIQAWTPKFVELNLQIQSMRNEVISQLQDYLNKSYRQVESSKVNSSPTITYKLGWNSEFDLAELLAKNQGFEIKRRSCNYGVHRDDIIFQLDDTPVKNILSRGETKRFVLALLLAAEALLVTKSQKHCIWVLDDIAAELDYQSIVNAFSVGKSQNNQMFFTCIEKDLAIIQQAINFEHAVFHVKHGQLLN
ncbi:DNA replication and repair protein RecF [Catenovulum sp. 2E275]|uniref:DNA replication/repair protein RecF n=1 Tax=Catenovulum sp. 2E275 TaxID=2980497 RepID=UPI0021CE11E8|nr:DNA replication and repair protein RecF [Catenovulum sp. 2E275]MCU4675815.1 DNA replication and repair protein RecF [Catenovulum sp. 2E275]